MQVVPAAHTISGGAFSHVGMLSCLQQQNDDMDDKTTHDDERPRQKGLHRRWARHPTITTHLMSCMLRVTKRGRVTADGDSFPRMAGCNEGIGDARHNHDLALFQQLGCDGSHSVGTVLGAQGDHDVVHRTQHAQPHHIGRHPSHTCGSDLAKLTLI